MKTSADLMGRLSALLLILLLATILFACGKDGELPPPTTVLTTVEQTPEVVTPGYPIHTSTSVPSTETDPPQTTVPVTPTESAPTTAPLPITTTLPLPETTPAQPVTTLRPILTNPNTTHFTVTTLPITSAPPASPYEELPRDAQHVLVYDATDREILYSTGAEKQVYPASITKLLMLRFALTVADGETVFTVGNEIDLAPWDSSKAKIRKGEQYIWADMAAALLLPSGNDAAYTVATHCGRLLAGDPALSPTEAVSRFMEGLNAYAADLGLSGTHFVTPDGYHDPAHVTTVADLLQITLHATAHPLIAQTIKLPSYRVTDLATGRSQTWQNSNFLLDPASPYYYAYADGAKTGFHTPAGSCLVSTAQKDGRRLVVIVLKCSDKMVRFADAKRFLELGFALQGPASDTDP